MSKFRQIQRGEFSRLARNHEGVIVKGHGCIDCPDFLDFGMDGPVGSDVKQLQVNALASMTPEAYCVKVFSNRRHTV